MEVRPRTTEHALWRPQAILLQHLERAYDVAFEKEGTDRGSGVLPDPNRNDSLLVFVVRHRSREKGRIT
jgi:hypothetical protein